MTIDLIALQNTVTKDDVRYIMSHNPFEPLSRTTVDQMIASGELKKPNRRGKFLVWTKEYIAAKNEMSIELLNNILKAVEQDMKAS